MSYSDCVSLSTFFQFSRQNPGRIVYISLISRFSLFLAIFQILQCVILILHGFQCFSLYFMSYHVSFSFSSFVIFLAIFQVLQYAFLIFHLFQCFSPYSMSYSVCVSFTTSLVSCHTLGPTVYIFIFTFFSEFLTIFQVLVCVFHFVHFAVFLATNQVLYCVFPIFQDFTVSRYIPGPTVNVSHFARFSVFLTIFHVLPCVCLIFFVR